MENVILNREQARREKQRLHRTKLGVTDALDSTKVYKCATQNIESLVTAVMSKGKGTGHVIQAPDEMCLSPDSSYESSRASTSCHTRSTSSSELQPLLKQQVDTLELLAGARWACLLLHFRAMCTTRELRSTKVLPIIHSKQNRRQRQRANRRKKQSETIQISPTADTSYCSSTPTSPTAPASQPKAIALKDAPAITVLLLLSPARWVCLFLRVRTICTLRLVAGTGQEVTMCQDLRSRIQEQFGPL